MHVMTAICRGASRRFREAMSWAPLAAAFLCVPFVCPQANEARASDFYSGKTIEIVVAYPAGNGYDVYTRAIARHMGRHIPGNPSFIVRNMPGASGLRAANFIYNVAPHDGLMIGSLSRSVPIQQKMRNSSVKFDASKFNWIGTSSSYRDDAYCLVVTDKSPAKSFDDLRTASRPILFGASAVAGDSFFDVVQIAREVFNLNIKLVKGYESPETIIAMERGEIDGRAIGISSLRQFRPDWADGKGVRFLIQFAHKTRWERLPYVPTGQELAKSKEDLELIQLLELPMVMARPYAAPPGTPPDRVKILRQAFLDTHRDPAFLAEAKKLQLDISPLGGDAIEALLTNVERIPPSTVDRYIAALEKP
ncbi:MAG: hypothetical protein IT536_03840 [Hyphomicrobiales bacterium]|nr:hypothetical protein [Hyphomicrobiales bacterium]